MKDKISFNCIKNYRFYVYKHHLVIKGDMLITRQFIVLRDVNNTIITFTKLHRFIRSSKNKVSRSIADDGNNRFSFVCAFLNYIFIDNYDKYGITTLTELTLDMIKDYFLDYGLSPDDSIHSNTKNTVERCATVIIDFLVSYLEKYETQCVLKKSILVKKVEYRTKMGQLKTKYVPAFDIYHSNIPKTIFRDMPDSVFEIFMSYAANYYKDIFLLMCLSAFAGLRPSEACNVRQKISPLGSGLVFKKINGNITSIAIDLTKERNLRSDLKPVGKIKKERIQKVYPKFIHAFSYAYEIYTEYLSTCKFEKEYCPMTVNSRGMAMTYDLYYSKFRSMTEELRPILLTSSDAEVVEFGNELFEHNISPHIFRHWFTVQLCLYGEDVASLQFWRGDKTPESALRYLANKGKLEKQLKYVSNEVFNFMNFQAALHHGKEYK